MTMVPVTSLDAVGRSTPDLARWDVAFPAEANAAFVFCRDTVEPGRAFHARCHQQRQQDDACARRTADHDAVADRADRKPGVADL